MSDTEKKNLLETVETIRELHKDDIDLDTTSEEVGLEDLTNGQGIAETGASIGAFGCCSLCRS